MRRHSTKLFAWIAVVVTACAQAQAARAAEPGELPVTGAGLRPEVSLVTLRSFSLERVALRRGFNLPSVTATSDCCETAQSNFYYELVQLFVAEAIAAEACSGTELTSACIEAAIDAAAQQATTQHSLDAWASCGSCTTPYALAEPGGCSVVQRG